LPIQFALFLSALINSRRRRAAEGKSRRVATSKGSFPFLTLRISYAHTSNNASFSLLFVYTWPQSSSSPLRCYLLLPLSLCAACTAIGRLPLSLQRSSCDRPHRFMARNGSACVAEPAPRYRPGTMLAERSKEIILRIEYFRLGDPVTSYIDIILWSLLKRKNAISRSNDYQNYDDTFNREFRHPDDPRILSGDLIQTRGCPLLALACNSEDNNLNNPSSDGLCAKFARIEQLQETKEDRFLAALIEPWYQPSWPLACYAFTLPSCVVHVVCDGIEAICR